MNTPAPSEAEPDIPDPGTPSPSKPDPSKPAPSTPARGTPAPRIPDPGTPEPGISAPGGKPPRTIPRWLAYVLFSIVWGLLPWAISLLGPRYGWQVGRPGIWNWLGLIPLAVGIAGSVWVLQLHFAASRQGLDFEPNKEYLITHGAYTFSRNPAYLFELALMLGWVIFYGSLAVLVAFLAWWAYFNFFQVPSEERRIEARFGETYREYRRRVPRWIRITRPRH